MFTYEEINFQVKYMNKINMKLNQTIRKLHNKKKS